MSLLTQNLEFSKNDIFEHYLKNCSHLIELDFLRQEIDKAQVWSTNHEMSNEKICALCYSIREIGDKNDIQFEKYPSLLFLEEYNPVQNYQIGQTYIKDSVSNDFLKQINSFSSIHQIPEFLRTKNIIELQSHFTVQKIIELIDKNISYIQNIGFQKLYQYSVYIQLYHEILVILVEAIGKNNFLESEVQTLQNFFKSIQFLKIAVESDIQRQESLILKDDFEKIKVEKKYYVDLLNLIDHIEITFHKNTIDKSDIDWIKGLIDTSCSLRIKGQVVHIENFSHNLILLKEYSSLTKYDSIDVQLVMEEVIEENEDEDTKITSHTIEIESSPWAYIFNKIYGNDPSYTKDKDDKVQEVLKYIQRTGIPSSYLIR